MRSYSRVNISTLSEVRMASFTSSADGQSSWRKTSAPALSFPNGSLVRSRRMSPANAYATTSGGEAR